MNKFKKILLGALSVLTLGLFAVSGTKVNAAEIEDVYSFNLNDFSGIAVGSSKTVTSAESEYGHTLDVTLTNTASKAATSINSSRLKIDYNNSNDTVEFSFTNSLGNVEVTVGYNTQSDTKGWTGSFDLGSSVPLVGKSGSHTFGAGAAGDHTLVLSNNDSTKALYITSLSIKETYEGVANTYNVTYNLNGGTYDSGSTLSDTTDYAKNASVTLPDKSKMAKDDYIFDGWISSNNEIISKDAINYTITSNVTLTAKWIPENPNKVINGSSISSYLGNNSEYVVSNTMSYFDDSMFTLNVGLKLYKNNSAYTLPDSSTSAYYIQTQGSSFNSGNVRTIGFKAPARGSIVIWFMASSNNRTVALYSGSETNVGNYKNVSGKPYEANKVVSASFNVAEGQEYQIGANNGAISIFKVEFVSGIQVYQQEATDKTIGEDAATYIRFVAIIQDVDDINSSDFGFKIYRQEKVSDTVYSTQSIERNVATYSSLKLNGNIYSVALQDETTVHSFDGTDELYAIFVIGLTNADYSGYTVFGQFTYNGAEYTTSGYTFA